MNGSVARVFLTDRKRSPRFTIRLQEVPTMNAVCTRRARLPREQFQRTRRTHENFYVECSGRRAYSY